MISWRTMLLNTRCPTWWFWELLANQEKSGVTGKNLFLCLTRPAARPGETLLAARSVPLAEGAVVAHRRAAAEGCRLLWWVQPMLLQHPLSLWGKKNLIWFSVQVFSIARCLTFSYFFLIVSIAIGCCTCFFSTFTMPDRIKYNRFSLVAI